MRKNVIWLCVAVAASVAWVVMLYLAGRSMTVWMFAPVIFVPIGVSLVCCGLLLGSWIKSLFTRSHRLGKGLLFLLALFLAVASAATTRYFDLYQRGFDDYARAVLTPDEWRELARLAQDRLKPLGASREQGGESYVEAIADAKSGTAVPIGNLPTGTRLFATTEDVTFYWGSALTGHRFIVVFTRKGGRLPDDEIRRSFIAENIATYFSV